MWAQAELEHQLSERIHEPLVRDVFDQYVQCGGLACYTRILERIPEEAAKRIALVQANQVYKEKALWPVYAAQGMGLNEAHAVKIGAAVDLLWALSIVVDDILDNDTIRANGQSLWVQVGKNEAGAIAFQGLDAVSRFLAEEVSPETAELAQIFVKKGLESVAVHARMGFDIDINALLLNFIDRNDFHTVFPVYALSLNGRVGKRELEELCLGLRLFNQGGQVVNDLRDITPGQDGIARLSDLGGGRISLALKCLYDNLKWEDKKLLERLFGCQTISLGENLAVIRLATNFNFRQQMRRRIADTYERGEKLAANYLCPKGKSTMIEWRRYKTRICNEL